MINQTNPLLYHDKLLSRLSDHCVHGASTMRVTGMKVLSAPFPFNF